MSFPDPAAAEAAFYAAFRDLDLDTMRSVWVDSDNTSCIHPGGALLQGSAAILASWEEIFRDSQPPRVEHRLIQASADGGLAVHTVEENVSTGTGNRRALILATNVYGYLDGGWRMLAHHASLPLVESAEGDSRRASLH
ncbi:MAG: nuclear transport factor 2 family protein [Chromatiaceae bacterium]|nr:nuclear transport factor 2 family protein [Chromatiaceae bacterium]MCP5312677.1 nuclear transport factor 2 family protein [Chromatiaceae bacterium]